MFDTAKLYAECEAEAAVREDGDRQGEREMIIAAAQRLLCCDDVADHKINIYPWRLDCHDYLTDGVVHFIYRSQRQRWSAVYHCSSCHKDIMSSLHCSVLKPLFQDWFQMKQAHKCKPAPVKFFAGTADQVEQKSKQLYQQGYRLHTISCRGDEWYAVYELGGK